MPSKKPQYVFTQPLPTKGHYKIYSVATGEMLGMIKGENAKMYWEAFDTNNEFLMSGKRKKECMDYFREMDKKSRMAEGGGIGFEKLSNQVAKEYEGDKVAPEYQGEYGKTYSKEEAKEVGDKVAGKVYWQQRGYKFGEGGEMDDYDYEDHDEYATGGSIKKYEYSPSIEEQKTWDEKKITIYDAYANSYNAYQDLLQERKQAIGRNDKEEIKSIDLRLKNKLHVIKYAYSELTGTAFEEEFKDGGNLDSLDARISKAIFKAYGDIDDAIEFKFNDPDSGVAPYRLVFLAVQKGFITPEEINKDLLNSAYETSSETADAEEIGSSDMNFYVWSMLRDAGFDMKISNGSYVRVNGKMAHGGEVDNDDCEDDEYATGGSIESTRLKYAKKDIALVMKQGFMSIFGTKYGLLNLSYEDGIFIISDNKYNPRTESYNVLFEGDKKGAIEFVADSYVVEGFANGGSMPQVEKTYYIILEDGSFKEFKVKHPKEIVGIYFTMGINGLEKGTPMVHFENALNPLYNEDGTFVDAMPEYAGKDYYDFKNKMAEGGNVEEDQDYYRVFRNNAGKDIAVKIVKDPIFGKFNYYVDGSLRGQFETFKQAREEVNYENFDMYKDGGNIYSKDESMDIARTILQQMGGRARLEAFTGAYNFAVGDGSVMFRIKNRGVNFVKVKLNGKDLYDVTFGRVSGTNFKIVEQLDDVYAEDLIDIFEKSTGMYLRFEDGGMMARGGSIEKIEIGTKIQFNSQIYKVSKKSTFGWVLLAENGDKIIKNDYELKELLDRGKYIIVSTKMATGGGVEDIKNCEIIILDENSKISYRDGVAMSTDSIKKILNEVEDLSDKLVYRNNEISVYKLNNKYATGGSIEEDHIIVYFDDESQTGKTYKIGGKSFDNESDAKEYAKSKGYSTEINEIHYATAYAKGGLVVTSIKDIPNFQEELEAGRITYRGLGLGKLWDDFYKIAGEGGTRIKVKGKEYYITDSEFDTFSRDSSGKMRIKFDAPHRRFEKGGVFNSEFYKEGGSVKKQKYAYVQAKTTSGKNVFKFFEEVPTHKQVYAYFKTVKDENGNPIILNDTSIHVEEVSDFNRDLFLEKANEIAIRTFGSPIKELDDMMFSFDKNSLSVFKFEAELENGMEVSIQTVDGMIVIEAEDEDKFKKGGGIDINFEKDTDYVKRENIKVVNYKNGKELYNWDYWDSDKSTDKDNSFYSGLYISKKPLSSAEAEKQYSMFKKGGKLPKANWEKLPKDAFYIKRSDIASVIVYDENKGEEIEIPANRIVNGIWFDNSRTQMIIDRARKEGLIPDNKTKKKNSKK